MTYYELVDYIEELKDKTITNEIIKKINEFNIEYPQDVMVRLIDHIINTILKKLVDQRDFLIDNLNNIKSPNELTLQVQDLKVTLKDAKKLLEVKYLDNNLIQELKEQIHKYSDEYITIIKKHYNGIISNDYAIILNNLKLMEEK